MEKLQQNYDMPEAPRLPAFPTGKREFLFLLLILITGWLLCNSVFYAGLNLGFAIFAGCAILLSTGYLLWQGHKLTVYSGLLLGMSLVICGSFARSDAGFVKFIMFLFLILSSNLGLCLLSGQNHRRSDGITSLLDVPHAVFVLGVGRCPESFRGVRQGVQESGALGRKGSAVVVGVLISIPLLAIVIPLLIRADAGLGSGRTDHQCSVWHFSGRILLYPWYRTAPHPKERDSHPQPSGCIFSDGEHGTCDDRNRVCSLSG